MSKYASKRTNKKNRSSNLLIKRGKNFTLFFGGLCITVLVIACLFYLVTTYQTSTFLKQRSNTTPQQSPRVLLHPIENVNLPHQIRVSNFIMDIPNGWLPTFHASGKVILNKKQISKPSLITCIFRLTCDTNEQNYSLSIEQIKFAAYKKDILLENIKKEMIPDYDQANYSVQTFDTVDILSRYENNSKTKHTSLIIQNEPDTIYALLLSASSQYAHYYMMDEYTKFLSTIRLRNIDNKKVEQLTSENIYKTSIQTIEDRTNFAYSDDFIDSFLAPKDSKEFYSYFQFINLEEYETKAYTGMKYTYMLTDNPYIKEGIYGTNKTQITVYKDDVSFLLPYVKNPKYCETDSDCSYSASTCQMGAYNQYRRNDIVFGCGPGTIETLGSAGVIEEELNCKNGFEVEYEAISCIKNSCTMIQPRAVCSSL